MKNKLVVFEGIDGVGKSTLARRFESALRKQGIPAVRYESLERKDIGFNCLKPFIKRAAPIDSSLLFYLSSAIYKSSKIKKLLSKKWVICDRYIFSTLSYHKIRNADLSILNFGKLPIIKPDYLFLVEIDENIRLERVRARRVNRKADLVVKTKNNLIGKMEDELKKFHPVIVDNSRSVDEVVNELIEKVLKK